MTGTSVAHGGGYDTRTPPATWHTAAVLDKQRCGRCRPETNPFMAGGKDSRTAAAGKAAGGAHPTSVYTVVLSLITLTLVKDDTLTLPRESPESPPLPSSAGTLRPPVTPAEAPAVLTS